MLVLTLKAGEEVLIGNDIRIVAVEIRGKQVHLGIEAPPEVLVLRGNIKRALDKLN